MDIVIIIELKYVQNAAFEDGCREAVKNRRLYRPSIFLQAILLFRQCLLD